LKLLVSGLISWLQHLSETASATPGMNVLLFNLNVWHRMYKTHGSNTHGWEIHGNTTFKWLKYYSLIQFVAFSLKCLLAGEIDL
jgi:hypothetical protein